MKNSIYRAILFTMAFICLSIHRLSASSPHNHESGNGSERCSRCGEFHTPIIAITIPAPTPDEEDRKKYEFEKRRFVQLKSDLRFIEIPGSIEQYMPFVALQTTIPGLTFELGTNLGQPTQETLFAATVQPDKTIKYNYADIIKNQDIDAIIRIRNSKQDPKYRYYIQDHPNQTLHTFAPPSMQETQLFIFGNEGDKTFFINYLKKQQAQRNASVLSVLELLSQLGRSDSSTSANRSTNQEQNQGGPESHP